jgi:hypothetical protein
MRAQFRGLTLTGMDGSARALAASLSAVCAFVVSACGGTTQPIAHNGSRIGPTAGFSAKPGLLGSAASAGSSLQSYYPSGKIIADDRFRPNVNGFAFENYGNDAGPINLTPVNVEHLFGPQVCAAGNGKSCVLIPSAKAWMVQENAAMADGHCMGFSVTALRFFTGNLAPSTFGASTTPKLPVQGNDALQSQIAEDWAYQSLPSVRRAEISGTPAHVLQMLVNALNGRKETYTLAIIKADGTGGHAITPFAVEDRGAGRYRILVYDNNFPGIVRYVDVDTTADTWHYVGGINPSDTREIYEGNAETQSMFLFPTTPGETTQPCPFCSPNANTNPNPRSVLPSKNRFIEVALTTNSSEHPHLLFINPATGQKTGYAAGQLVQQNPEILVNQSFAVRDWSSSVEPTYDLQFGHPGYEVVVDGGGLTHQVTAEITVNGAGVLFAVRHVHIAPGQKDYMLLPTDDLGITYASAQRYTTTPEIETEFAEYVAGRPRLIVISTAMIDYAPGSPMAIRIHPETGTAVLSSPGKAPKLIPAAHHQLYVDSQPLGPGAPGHTYFTTNFDFNTASQQAEFNYLNPDGPTLPIQIVQIGSGRPMRTVSAPPYK